MVVRILVGDALEALRGLPDRSVQCCVTSPPYYGLRCYGVDGQIGLEETPRAFIERLVGVFREVRRVLRDDGTLWLNIGDGYGSSGGSGRQGSRGQRFGRRHTQEPLTTVRQWREGGIKPKDLIGIPWMLAFALRDDGWYLRQEIIWHKPNVMPESAKDRCTKAHESLFLLSRSSRYFFDAKAIEEPASPNTHMRRPKDGVLKITSKTRAAGFGVKNNASMSAAISSEVVKTRNRRSVWSIQAEPFHGAHFATMPTALARDCIAAGSRPGDVVLDPFGGAGTTGLVAERMHRDSVLIELNPAYAADARARIGLFALHGVAAE